MNIRLITAGAPVCMGVCCPRHAHCERYLAVDASSPDDHRIATCANHREFPLYVPAATPEPGCPA